MDHAVAVGMAPNPKPQHPVLNLDSQRAGMQADSNRPESAELLK